MFVDWACAGTTVITTAAPVTHNMIRSILDTLTLRCRLPQVRALTLCLEFLAKKG